MVFSQFLFNRRYETLTFLEKRISFLRALLNRVPFKADTFENNCKYLGRGAKNCNYYPEHKFYVLKLNETSGEYELSQGVHFNGINFSADWNTRDIFLSEGVLELEDKTSFARSLNATYSTCISLIKFNVHFAVFYADGMRTPHIHIYDLFPQAVDWAEKELAMVLFCRKVVPFEYFHLLDTNLFGEHTIALEFSKHWKTGHIKKLLFEHVPGSKVETDLEVYYRMKGISTEVL